MAGVIYKPVPKFGMPDRTTQYGYAFAAGKATEVEDGPALEKFKGHPFFDVAGKGEAQG